MERKSVEIDLDEKVPSRPRNQRFGNETARFESSAVIVQMVDDEVDDIVWKKGNHNYRTVTTGTWAAMISRSTGLQSS